MKKFLLAAALTLPASIVLAQTPAPAPAQAPAAPAPQATTRAADGQAVVVTAQQITAMAQRMRQAYNMKQDTRPNVRHTIIEATPYSLGLEHRLGKANASTHPGHAELMIVIEGSGLYTHGGTLVNAGAPSKGGVVSIVGSDIAGGTVRNVNKGDIFIVPENTPHMLTPDEGGPLLVATVHVPRAGNWAAPQPGGRGAGTAPKLGTLASDLPIMYAAAREALPSASRFFAGGTIASLPPYRVGMEMRSPKGIASVHKNNAEFMWVLEGEGVVETGGTVVNPRDTGANIDGDSLNGATINTLKKGDFIFVPKGVPHLARSNGNFVLATMHVPGDAP